MSDQTPFSHLYADRAQGFTPSPVRSVWDVMMEPGIISLAGGNPDLASLPLAEIGEVASRMLAKRGTEVLQYGAGAGTPELRNAVIPLLNKCGIEADADQLLITAGSQMGIEIVTGLLCDPGDVVLAESPTYVGAIGVFHGFEVDVQHVECDEDGLIPEALVNRIAELRAAGKPIKFLYTIPNFGNPSGVTLTQSRRQEIAKICREAGIAIVEDDPYGQLSFSGETPRAIRSYDDSVIYLGSMSKIFSPGIRIGWVLAPESLRARLQMVAETATIHASILSENLATAYLTEFDWEPILNSAVQRYKERAQALIAALEEHMPEGVTWTTPEGGFFVWLTLPQELDVDELFDEALKEKVVFIDGNSFYAEGQNHGNNLRLSYSLETPEKIQEAVARLGAAMKRLLSQ